MDTDGVRARIVVHPPSLSLSLLTIIARYEQRGACVECDRLCTALYHARASIQDLITQRRVEAEEFLSFKHSSEVVRLSPHLLPRIMWLTFKQVELTEIKFERDETKSLLEGLKDRTKVRRFRLSSSPCGIVEMTMAGCS